jgi:uncharacterized protein (TIGR02453 family)
MPAHFTPASLQFLRGLRRNNTREWFNARKGVYEAEVKAPMLAVISVLNEQMLAFAPQHVRAPHKTMMRIYRDIRFSPDKRPYKSHASAWWVREGLEKTSGGGYYLQFGPDGLLIAAGCYMPEREQLLAIRRAIEKNHAALRRLLADKTLRRLLDEWEGCPLTRVPKGFCSEHPATDLLRQRQWGFSTTLPAESALQPTLIREVIKRFRAAAPIVDFLNAPLIPQSRPRPLFGLPR